MKLISIIVLPVILSLINLNSVKPYKYCSTQFVKSHEAVKYLFIVITTNEPIVKTRSSIKPNSSAENLIGLPELIQEEHYLQDRTFIYKSEIITCSNYNEDVKYREMDRFENKIRNQLQYSNVDPDLGVINSTIKSRDAFVFSSYAAASRYRSNYNN